MKFVVYGGHNDWLEGHDEENHVSYWGDTLCTAMMFTSWKEASEVLTKIGHDGTVMTYDDALVLSVMES